MPDVETIVPALYGKLIFASIDLIYWYWSLPLDQDSQECQRFTTADGVLTPSWVLHGHLNARPYC